MKKWLTVKTKAVYEDEKIRAEVMACLVPRHIEQVVHELRCRRFEELPDVISEEPAGVRTKLEDNGWYQLTLTTRIQVGAQPRF